VIPALEASDFVTIGLLVALEGLLSADNAMVCGDRAGAAEKASSARRYDGILGAFVFRGLATLFAVT
jgi:predicted tellurium resistance membrane protein TerC